MVVSPVKDSLRLLFSDEYNISGSDYQKLSEILISNGLSERAFSNGIVQLVKLLYENDLKLPISLNYLQEVWNQSGMSIPLVKVLAPGIRSGAVKLRRMSSQAFFKHKTLLRSDNEPVQKKYIAVYYTDVLQNVYNGITSILSKYTRTSMYQLDESMEIAPKKVVSFVNKTNQMLSIYNIHIDIESYMKDLANNQEEINLVISRVSNYRISSKEMQKRAKNLRSIKYVHGIEVYKESNSELFLGLITDIVSSYKEIPLQLFTFIEDLEVNGV